MDQQKVCAACGAVCSETDLICPSCGSNQFVGSGAAQPAQPIQESSAPATELSMKWYKFLINFALFAGAFLNVISGFNYITGGIYTVQSNGEVTSEMVYSVFSSMQAVDVIYGVLMIAVAAFSIYTRFRLAKYKSNGPLCLYIVYGANVAIPLFYAIAVSSIVGESGFDQSTISSLAVSIGMIIVNYLYFKKRKALFTNP